MTPRLRQFDAQIVSLRAIKRRAAEHRQSVNPDDAEVYDAADDASEAARDALERALLAFWREARGDWECAREAEAESW